MRNSLKLAVSAIAAAAVMSSASANATVFSFDEFYIEKGATAGTRTEIFRDSFNDGAIPGSGPDDGLLGAGNTYFVSGGGIVSENAIPSGGSAGNGRLLVESGLGQLVANPNGDDRLRNRIRRNRSTNPGSSAALTEASSWTVNVMLDLSTLPVNDGEAFGVRVEDFSGSNPNGGNDRLLLEVRRSNQSGTLGVLFSGLEFNGVGIENFDFFALDPLLTSNSTADQILLSLSKDENSAVVDAEFLLFAGGSFLLSQGLDNVGNTSAMIASLYTDEAFTRAALHTIENTEVPEPGAIALLGVGIAGIGFLRRRKTK